MKSRTRILLFSALALAAAAPVAAQETAPSPSDGSTCELEGRNVRMRRVSYVPYATASWSNLRASCTSETNCWVHMRGWLYYRDPAVYGPVKWEKVLVYNHGYNKERSEPCAIVKYFTSQGWVVFAPLRRGHTASLPSPLPENWRYINSTGVAIEDFVANCGHRDPLSGTCDKTEDELQGEYMHRQVKEAEDQLAFVRSLPAIGDDGLLADRDHITLLGHSFGGILTIFANGELETPYHNVAIDISAGALSWTTYWRDELGAAQLLAKRPTYFLQPKNEFTIRPTQHLASVAMRDGQRQRSQAAIFPPTPWDPDAEDPQGRQAHETFIGGFAQVKIWGPSVIEFSERYPRSAN
jgi:hypothetical protein